MLSAYWRVSGFSVERFEHEMYEQRALVRMLAMRRTMFVVPYELGGLLDAAATRDLVARERRRVAVAAERQGITRDGERWIDEAYEAVLAVLRGREPLASRDVTPMVPHLQMKLSWGTPARPTEIGAASRVLFLLALEGHTTRARPLGSWLSSQYRWAPFDEWFGGDRWPVVGPDEARRRLVEAWLRTYGPGTLADLAWWGKWPLARVRAALRAAGAVPVTLEPAPGAPAVDGWALPDDLDDTEPPAEQAVALLPGLDPALMGWKERDWILGPHGAALFDRNGNAGPLVLVDGAAIGPWAQRADATVVWQPLEPVDRRAASAVDAAAARLTAWLDGVRVTPRFPNPLERSLAASA